MGGRVSAELPVAVGDVLVLAEEDYRFGIGPLTLRVTALLHVQQLTDGAGSICAASRSAGTAGMASPGRCSSVSPHSGDIRGPDRRPHIT